MTFRTFASWTSLLVLFVSCSGGSSGSTPQEDIFPDQGVTDLETGDTWIDDLGQDQGTSDLAFDADDAVDDVDSTDGWWVDAPADVQEEDPCPPYPGLAQCQEVGPTPTGTANIEAFVAGNAVPLMCETAEGRRWDFQVFLEEFADHDVLLFGEIHGSKEIGATSADLFEAMVREHGVDTLVLEMPVDTQQGLNDYLATGNEGAGTLIAQDLWNQYSEYMFRKSLPRRARMLVQEGYDIQVVCVDTPQRLSWCNDQILAASADLTNPDLIAVVRDQLPAPKGMSDYGMMGLQTAYVNQCQTYYENVMDNLDAICTELTAENCSDLEWAAYTLYIGSIFLSQDFMMAAGGGGGALDFKKVMSDREVLISHLFAKGIEGRNVAYAHMGAAHCAKTGDSVGRFLHEEHPPTQGRVYSVYPAYGQGSKIFYGFSAQTVPPEPQLLWSALKDQPLSAYFLSTSHPGQQCEDNPFQYQMMWELAAYYGEAWDSFFWWRLLTPDTPSFGPWSVVLPLVPSASPWH